jgi:hypothetical protein
MPLLNNMRAAVKRPRLSPFSFRTQATSPEVHRYSRTVSSEFFSGAKKREKETRVDDDEFSIEDIAPPPHTEIVFVPTLSLNLSNYLSNFS